MRINLPRLLNSSMSAKDRLHPTKTSIKRNLYSLHTASITLPPGEPAVKERDWIALYDRYGSAGIFRVSRMRTAYGQRNELSLKHGFCVLEDDTVKVTDGKVSGTAEAVIRHLFSCAGVVNAPQYWTLGNFAQTPTIEYEYSNVKLSDAVWDVLRKVPGYAFTFDQSRFLWVLGLVRLSDADACEGRFGRNLDSCIVEMDDSSLCTRAYLDDRDGYTDADTVSAWGVVSQTLTVPEDAEQADIDAYVAAYLDEHKNPRITISLNAADMSDATGETLDRFQLGAVCRACLPEYKTTVRERIVSITSPDVYGDPDRAEIAMANRMETASDLLAKLNKNTSALASASTVTNRRIGGVSKKVENTDIELIRTQETLIDTRYRMSKAGIVIDGDAQFVKQFAYQENVDLLAGTVEENSAQILVMADQILQTVTRSEFDALGNRVTTAESELLVQAEQISAKVSQYEFDQMGERVATAESEIIVQAEQIAQRVTKYDFDALGKRVTTAEGEIVVQAGEISQRVTKDGIIGAINLTPEDTLIQSKRINLVGYVTMSSFEAEIAKIDNIFAGYSEISALGINGNLYAKNANLTDNVRILERTCEWQEITLYKGGKITVSGTTNYVVYDNSGNPIGQVRGIPSGWSISAYKDETYTFMTA